MSLKRPAGRAHRTTDRDGVVEVRDQQGDRTRQIVVGLLVALAVVGIAVKIRERLAPTPAPSRAASTGAEATSKRAARAASKRAAPIPVAAAPQPNGPGAAQPDEQAASPSSSSSSSSFAPDEASAPEGLVADAPPQAGEGIAAFPAPGTKRIKPGIIVPEDFPLPPGYVRHYQTTDKGQMLPAILTFHPDHPPIGADGHPVAVPPDRVVPPDQVPAGLPIHLLEVPKDAYADRDEEGSASPR